MNNDILNTIASYGVLPLVHIDDTNDALPLAQSLIKGNIPLMEIIFSKDKTTDSVKNITSKEANIIVGVGSVHSVDEVKEVIENGAKFITTLGFNREVVAYCVENNIPVCPGCTSLSDIEEAISFGLKIVKFSLAETYGGIKTLRSLSEAFPQINFIASGGINNDNILDYLDLENVAACSDRFIPSLNLLNDKDFNAITLECKKLMSRIFDFTIGHIGINADTKENAESINAEFTNLFDTSSFETEMAIFNGNLTEIMKKPFLGEKGHICVDTRDLNRAMAMLKRKGVTFNEDYMFYNGKGQLVTAYLNKEIAGFALHVRQKMY